MGYLKGHIDFVDGNKQLFRVIFNVNYLIQKTNENYPIENDRFSLMKYHDIKFFDQKLDIYFNTFGQAREEKYLLPELKQINHVIRYNTPGDVAKALQGLILVPDKEFAKKRKAELLEEIAELNNHYMLQGE